MNPDAVVPDREACVLRNLLDAHAARTPDKVFAVTPGGEETTYAQLHQSVRSHARALQDLGIRQGDFVIVWMPNSLDMIRIWFAINYIGAICVPINTAYRGGILEHVLRNSNAQVLIGHKGLVDRLDGIDTAGLKTVIVTDDAPDPVGTLRTLPFSVLSSAKEPTAPEREIEPWDTQCVIYTSGTTGPSKGVESSYCHLHTMAISVISNCENELRLDHTDRFMVNMPIFHAGGVAPINAMLTIGGSLTLLDSFNTKTFWQDVQQTGTTSVILLGVMASFIMKQGPVAEAENTPLREAIVIPFTREAIDLRSQFNIDTHTMFNMSETSCPIVSENNPMVPGVCGKARKGVELRLVDAHDREVPCGEIGELVIRTARPWALTHAYVNNPQATADAFRNGWFHTGDAFRMDEHGNYFFVDRFKDSIRRRGENVSSFEVESEVTAHPAIREAAAVAVDSEHSEDEILIAIALAEGKTIDMEELIDFLRPRMAHFMVPRYVRVMDDLPKTPTQKIEKYVIRNQGITDDTWDREAAGIVLKREKLTD